MSHVKDANIDMYSHSQNSSFPEIPQRGHSQSLHDHRYYNNAGASSDP